MINKYSFVLWFSHQYYIMDRNKTTPAYIIYSNNVQTRVKSVQEIRGADPDISLNRWWTK